MHSPKPRYAVCDAVGAILIETDRRMRAWWTWFKNRKSGAVAYDRRSWVEDPNSWLRCGADVIIEAHTEGVRAFLGAKSTPYNAKENA